MDDMIVDMFLKHVESEVEDARELFENGDFPQVDVVVVCYLTASILRAYAYASRVCPEEERVLFPLEKAIFALFSYCEWLHEPMMRYLRLLYDEMDAEKSQKD